MKYYSIISLLLICSLFFNSCKQADNDLDTEIDSLVIKWVPDKREAVFNVEIEFLTPKEVHVKGETTISAAKEDLILFLKDKGYSVKDQLNVLPDSTVTEKPWALINLSVAQLRSKPSNSSELVSQAILGTPVKVLKKEKGWFLIQTPDDYISWIKKASLTFLTENEWKNWKQSDRVIFTERVGMIKDENGQEVADVVLGNIIQRIESKGSQTKVILPHGETGYLLTSHLSDFSEWKKDTTYLAENLIGDGKDLMGLPYLWGGTSPKAVDCSGFVKTIFFENGLILARDASQQIKYGDSVNIGDNFTHLQKGDLLFFGSKKTYKVTHVAMYIGDSEYIQAAGRVKINSLDSTKANFSGFRIASFLGARRYIGQKSQKGILFVKNHPWY